MGIDKRGDRRGRKDRKKEVYLYSAIYCNTLKAFRVDHTVLPATNTTPA